MQPQAFELYSRFIKEGDLCFDIGANMGGRTTIFLELGAAVVAVEPQRSCCHQLEKLFNGNERVFLVNKAAGRAEGKGEMLISDLNLISSLSKEWIEKVKASGRFRSHSWSRMRVVPVTTLDRLIENYGEPAFCKIDVEGYEYDVLLGLTRAVRSLSFEFTPEFIRAAVSCVTYLNTLGPYFYNYSLGESMSLALLEWVGPGEIIKYITSISDPDNTVFGDVYASCFT